MYMGGVTPIFILFPFCYRFRKGTPLPVAWTPRDRKASEGEHRGATEADWARRGTRYRTQTRHQTRVPEMMKYRFGTINNNA